MPLPELSPQTSFPEVLGASSTSDALRSLGTAAYTLYATPEHEKLHMDVADAAEADQPLPLQPSLDEIMDRIRGKVLAKADIAPVPTADGPTLTRLAGVLIQFTDYVPRLHNIATPYSEIADLREAVVDSADESGPLDLASQLDISLQHSDGEVPDALWRLFITSRLHSRWLDSSIVADIPDYTRDKKIELMKTWQDSLAAFKERRPGLSQDASGDTYYAWTHALAKFAFISMPAHESAATRLASRVFHNGTNIMHTLVHKVAQTQSVKSDHTVAAIYGNAVGQACVEAVPTANKIVRPPLLS
jgi:hypothetical protein